jgi:hypothetical protein
MVHVVAGVDRPLLAFIDDLVTEREYKLPVLSSEVLVGCLGCWSGQTSPQGVWNCLPTTSSYGFVADALNIGAARREEERRRRKWGRR